MNDSAETLKPLLRLEQLTIASRNRPLVSDVSLQIGRREIVGLAGESGSGKTLTCRSLSGLLPDGVTTAAGQLFFDGQEWRRTTEGWPKLRGKIVTIFQEPRLAVNPVRTIESQFSLVLREAGVAREAERKARVRDLLGEVQIAHVERVARSFPWELSGGMLQRVLVAMVLARRPALVVADEPTSNLDAAVRNRIMDLILETTRELNAGLLLVTHDLPLLMRVCERVYVMRNGEIIESGAASDLAREQAHPYTRLLLHRVRTRAAGAEPTAAASTGSEGA